MLLMQKLKFKQNVFENERNNMAVVYHFCIENTNIKLIYTKSQKSCNIKYSDNRFVSVTYYSYQVPHNCTL